MDHLRRLFEHMTWADARVGRALDEASGDAREARELYAHVLGTEDVWLARIEGAARGEVWPDPETRDLSRLARETQRRFDELLAGLAAGALGRPIAYVNSAGLAFESTLEDILLHIFLHGAYHRGQIAMLLRKCGAEPAPTDYIAFRRGVAAATRDDAR